MSSLKDEKIARENTATTATQRSRSALRSCAVQDVLDRSSTHSSTSVTTIEEDSEFSNVRVLNLVISKLSYKPS